MAERLARQMGMAGMGRVERAAEQADPAAPAPGQAGRQVEAGRIAQGRIWPLPRTRYL